MWQTLIVPTKLYHDKPTATTFGMCIIFAFIGRKTIASIRNWFLLKAIMLYRWPFRHVVWGKTKVSYKTFFCDLFSYIFCCWYGTIHCTLLYLLYYFLQKVATMYGRPRRKVKKPSKLSDFVYNIQSVSATVFWKCRFNNFANNFIWKEAIFIEILHKYTDDLGHTIVLTQRRINCDNT